VKDPIQTILSETNNRMDILVNNSGYVPFGAFEGLSMDEVRSLYETNVFGVIRVTQAVLPTMRHQKSGIIVNLSSEKGFMVVREFQLMQVLNFLSNV
jgi:NADP-dependent 3-hydroxy acid dehydrogenase YdfG